MAVFIIHPCHLPSSTINPLKEIHLKEIIEKKRKRMICNKVFCKHLVGICKNAKQETDPTGECDQVNSAIL